MSIPVEGPEIVTEPPASGKPASVGEFETPPQSTKPLGKMKVSEVAERLIDKAHEWGFSPDEVKAMSADSWTKLARDSGVIDQSKTGAKVTFNLTDPMFRRVWMGLANKLAGPAKSGATLMDELKASLPKE